MRLIPGEALRSIYADSQIAVTLFPLFERAPVTVRRPHFPFQQATDEFRDGRVLLGSLSPAPSGQFGIACYGQVPSHSTSVTRKLWLTREAEKAGPCDPALTIGVGFVLFG